MGSITVSGAGFPTGVENMGGGGGYKPASLQIY